METNNKNRRQVLKYIGGGVASVPIVSGVTSGKAAPDPDKIYTQALTKLQKTGNINTFHDHLQNNGFSATNKRKETKVPHLEKKKNVGIQELHASTMTTDLTLTEHCRYPEYTYVNFSWNFDMDEQIQGAEKPKDVVGIYYPNNDYDRISESQYAGPHATAPGNDNPKVGDFTPNGLAYEWSDWDAHKDLSNNEQEWPNLGSFVGVKLKKQEEESGDPVEPEERLVSVDYKHTSRTYPVMGKLKSVTISAGGLGISLGFGGQSWTGNWEADGTELKYDCDGR